MSKRKWTDMKQYIPTPQGTLYLSMIRDLYDNSIIAYKTGTQQSIHLVEKTIRAAAEKETVICLFVVQKKREDDSLFDKSSSLDIIPLLPFA